MTRSTSLPVVALLFLLTIPGCAPRNVLETTPGDVLPIGGPEPREKRLVQPEAARWAAPPPAEAGLPGADRQANQDLSLRFQNEPAVAVNLNDPQHLVAAWCEHFLYDTGWTLQLTTLAYGWSFDGGQTWQSQGIDFGNIPADVLTADPGLAFDSAGNVYFSILRYDPWAWCPNTRSKLIPGHSDPVAVSSIAVDRS